MTLKIDKNSRRKRRRSGNKHAVRSRDHSSSSIPQQQDHSNNATNNNSENEIRNQIQAEFQMLQSLIPVLDDDFELLATRVILNEFAI